MIFTLATDTRDSVGQSYPDEGAAWRATYTLAEQIAPQRVRIDMRKPSGELVDHIAAVRYSQTPRGLHVFDVEPLNQSSEVRL